DGATFTTGRVTAPASVAGDYGAAEASFTPRLSALPPVTAPVAATEPGLACGDLANAAQLQGRIALIDRGTCFFVDKVRRAQTAGAVGVVVINNVDGAPIEMGGQGDSSDIRIPALMISRLDGAILRGQLGAGLTMTLAAFAAVSRPELADQLNESSSRGPSITDGRLKPDLAAPGTGITSAKPGTGTGFTSLTGTSMAAPHAAGAAVLMRQAHPDWTVEDIKAALMNTAVPTRTDRGLPYPESRSGIGRLQMDAALAITAVVRADTGEGDVALSFGTRVLSEPLEELRNLRVVNHGDAPVTFQVGLADSAPVPGITLTPVVSSVTVGPGRSLLIPVQLTVKPAELRTRRDGSSPEFLGERPRQPLGEASGAVELRSDGQRLRVPWHVAVRAAAAFTATEPILGVPDQAVASIPVPTRGGAAHPRPLVSVLESVFSGPRGSLDSGNLIAAGIATDFRSSADPAAARVFFGFATAGPWVTPQYEHLALDVEVDADRDGDADFILFNSSAGNLSGQDLDASLSNDALMSLVLDTSRTTDAFTAGGLLNVLAPAVRDTAPYHNRVAILSAPIRSLGLGPDRTRFRYRLTTTGLRDSVQTESPWLDYDLAAPLVDATAFGIGGSPLFDEGREVRVQIARDTARHAGRGSGNPLQILLLHHHGQQISAERITLALDDSDTDNDRLPDAWELEWFGDLEATAGGDQDRDGLVNSGELEAGSNPLEVRLLPPDPIAGTLQWNGVSGRYYTVERAAAVSGPFSAWKRRIPGRDPVTTLEEPVVASDAGPVFLRVLPE
ncbi:MAG: S8 family serine peptidase, partial [Verrucomicrobia bacterium]|nr:S8 family serine peptidase [Verrucomicrobiota bacterium]